MKLLKNSLLILTLITPLVFFGQTLPCGTQFTEKNLDRVTELLSQPKINQRATYNVPVTYHLVAYNDGTKRVRYSNLLKNMCFVNEIYDNYDMNFFIHNNINQINNTTIASDGASQAASVAMITGRVNNTMNVYMADYGEGVAGYYSPAGDYVFVRNSSITDQSTTIPHEFGHFFSLPHTFFGWEGIEYKPGQKTATHDPTQPTPTTVNGIRVEYADGNNCSVAADRICDTDADYVAYIESNCALSGFADPSGAPVKPDSKNFMSYFNDNCHENFTPLQSSVMQADYNSRNWKSMSYNFSPVTESANLVFPTNNHGFDVDNVYLDWDPVPNATFYLVQVSRTSTFSTSTTEEFWVKDNTSIDVSDKLADGRNYYWRVWPFNNRYTCEPTNMPLETFNTKGASASLSNSIEPGSFSLVPNPAKNNSIVTVKFNANEMESAAIKILDINAKLISNVNITTTLGANSYDLNTSNLSAGSYIVQIVSDDSFESKFLQID